MSERRDTGNASATDHRGSRRLSGAESAVWYSVAAVSYVAVATFEKGLLTWILGPAWLVGVIVGGPAIVERLRRRR